MFFCLDERNKWKMNKKKTKFKIKIKFTLRPNIYDFVLEIATAFFLLFFFKSNRSIASIDFYSSFVLFLQEVLRFLWVNFNVNSKSSLSHFKIMTYLYLWTIEVNVCIKINWMPTSTGAFLLSLSFWPKNNEKNEVTTISILFILFKWTCSYLLGFSV